MGHEANYTGWDTSISAELIKKYGAVKSFEEAERLLERLIIHLDHHTLNIQARKLGVNSWYLIEVLA